jgi:hypothetical protein
MGARKAKFRFKNKLLSLDSTTISLCLDLFPWAKFRRAKGGVKAHVLLDHDDYLPSYVLITEAKKSDVRMAQSLDLNAGSIVAIDRGYNDYALFGKWTDRDVFFVTRLKDNAAYEVKESAIGPTDAALGVERQEFSPGVRRMMAVVGSDSVFEAGREQMELLAGLTVSTKSVERQAEQIGAAIMRLEQAEIQRGLQLDLPIPLGSPIPVIYMEIDGTGIPVVRKETQGRIGKVEGQPAHTREVKLGCVFTSVGVDQENRPVRDPASTTYVGAIETAEEFAPRIYREAYQRGWARAAIRVVLGDGAIWIWNIATEQFPGAILIVDF